MALYVFYFSRDDGSGSSFEALELESLADAQACAARLLAEHSTCARVDVWQDDRPLLSRRRPSSDAHASRAVA